jgi:hypothetical protein
MYYGQETLPRIDDAGDTLARLLLESRPYVRADLLQDSIDAIDYKNSVFGFCFLERVNDCFQENLGALAHGQCRTAKLVASSDYSGKWEAGL